MYHLTPKTGNRKLGPIAVTTSSRALCPDSCPLKKNGCYADGGPLAMHWNKVTDGSRGCSAADHADQVRKVTADGTFIRFNQAGDLPLSTDPAAALSILQAADSSRAAWTYTHHTDHADQVATLNATVKATVNLSANSLAEVDDLADQGSPVVCLSTDPAKVQTTPAGRRVVRCPAEYTDDLTCQGCGNGRPLCSRKSRTYAIAFTPHGSSVKKAAAVANS